jgi:hypothetical protein
MKRIIMATCLSAALALALPGSASAEATGTMGTEPAPMEKAGPVNQARQHILAAVDEGRKNNTNALVQHAEAGLQQVKNALAQKSLPDLDRAAQNLEEAIKHGKAGDANKATERAEAALNNIDAAKGAMGG